MALVHDADVEDDWRDATAETEWDGLDPDDHPAPPLTDEDAPPW